MTAGHGYSFGCFYFFLHLFRQFRQPIYPAGPGPVGSGCVYDNCVWIFNHAGGFPGRIIRQAEDGNVTRVQHFPPACPVFPLLPAQDQKLHIFPAFQPVRYPQTGSSGTSVDKNSFHLPHPLLPVLYIFIYAAIIRCIIITCIV